MTRVTARSGAAAFDHAFFRLDMTAMRTWRRWGSTSQDGAGSQLRIWVSHYGIDIPQFVALILSHGFTLWKKAFRRESMRPRSRSLAIRREQSLLPFHNAIIRGLGCIFPPILVVHMQSLCQANKLCVRQRRVLSGPGNCGAQAGRHRRHRSREHMKDCGTSANHKHGTLARTHLCTPRPVAC